MDCHINIYQYKNLSMSVCHLCVTNAQKCTAQVAIKPICIKESVKAPAIFTSGDLLKYLTIHEILINLFSYDLISA